MVLCACRDDGSVEMVMSPRMMREVRSTAMQSDEVWVGRCCGVACQVVIVSVVEQIGHTCTRQWAENGLNAPGLSTANVGKQNVTKPSVCCLGVWSGAATRNECATPAMVGSEHALEVISGLINTSVLF